MMISPNDLNANVSAIKSIRLCLDVCLTECNVNISDHKAIIQVTMYAHGLHVTASIQYNHLEMFPRSSLEIKSWP